MGWFTLWWQDIGLIGQIMACVAIPATLLMCLQLILTIIGAGFGEDSDISDLDNDGPDFDSADDADIDAGADSGIEHDADSAEGHDNGGAKLFTVRGVVAFFAIGGWAGLASISAGIPKIWSVQIALVSGAAAMILASLTIKLALRMQSSGNIDLKNALSGTAVVYITIPPSRSDTGKVTMLLQERFAELEAITDSAEALRPGTEVVVTGIRDGDCLIVEPVLRGGELTPPEQMKKGT